MSINLKYNVKQYFSQCVALVMGSNEVQMNFNKVGMNLIKVQMN